jgi:simple sugar transport system ATP-binding protein
VSAAPLLELSGIEKVFGTVIANQGIDLVLHEGEVLGLLGENGAGKTTLMNILFGLYRPDAGEILIDGRPAEIRGPADALRQGVGMVHQHFHLVDRMTVLENQMIGQKGRGFRLDREGSRARLQAIGERYGLTLDPARTVADLTVGEQQRLEIVKALYRGARILVLDEPTSVLTPKETEGLFGAIRAMAANGVGVIFISHKLDEVRAITDRLTVLRHGKVTATLANGPEVTSRRLAELMCGHELHPPARPPVPLGEPLLSLEKVSTGTGGHGVPLRDIDLALRAGEILGLAGVSGNGQRELAELIAGLLPARAGRMLVEGQQVARPTPETMRRRGIGMIPEDRIGAGLMTTQPLADSMVLPWLKSPRFSRHGVLDRAAINGFVAGQIESFGIRAAGPDVRTGTLSGGNLQKALLARELAFSPKILIAAQPTRGLDVAAQAFVHEQFLAMRAAGRAVLLISEDLEELFQISDRIAVMYRGRIVGEQRAEEAEVATIGLWMAGSGLAA